MLHSGLLSREKLIDHAAPHVISNLIELYVHFSRVIVVRFPQQLRYKYAIGQSQQLR